LVSACRAWPYKNDTGVHICFFFFILTFVHLNILIKFNTNAFSIFFTSIHIIEFK